MRVVKMYIDKFDREVEIDHDHPLAVAQRDKNAGKSKPKTISGKTAEELEKLNKTAILELVDEVTSKHPSFTVVREDGGTSEPTKKDYIAALSRTVD